MRVKGRRRIEGLLQRLGDAPDGELASKINSLEADLPVAQVAQVDRRRKQSKLVSPNPKNNAIFGFVIGLLLAGFAAYALSRLDRRLRSLAAIEALSAHRS